MLGYYVLSIWCLVNIAQSEPHTWVRLGNLIALLGIFVVSIIDFAAKRRKNDSAPNN